MADETTSTSVTEVVYSEWINPVFQAYATDVAVATAFVYEKRPANNSKTVSFPRQISDVGTPDDGGAGVDTEYDYTEGTGLSNTEFETEEASVSATELGVMRTLTDEALEDSADGIDLVNAIVRDEAHILSLVKDDDLLALMNSFTDTVGQTGVDLTISQLSMAFTELRRNGVHPQAGGLAVILDQQQGEDIESAVIATGTAMAVYEGAADRFLGIMPDAGLGMTAGLLMMFRGAPVFVSGLTDSVNAGADVAGGLIVRGDIPVNEPWASIGACRKRDFRLEDERDASLPGTELVGTERWGVGIINPAFGVNIVSDA